MSSWLHGIEREISDQSELYSNWWICHRDLSQLGENERTLFRKIINEAYHRGDCFCYFGHWMCQRIDEPEIQPGRARQPESGREISKEEFTKWNIARIFKLYDAGGKGYVTLADWQRLQGTSKDAQYKRLDAKHNGKVTLEEAQANRNVQAVLGGTFAGIDTNHDGWIDRKEAAAYVEKRQTLVP
jgi:hypothetical protein